MKNLLLTGALALTVFSTEAQDYRTPLQNTWNAFDTTQAQEPKQQLVNKLMLIAKKWNNDWAPHFYAALGKTIVSYYEKDETKHDALLDEAEKELDEAVTLLGKPNDETHVIAAMVANSRMMINPMQRWQKYGKIFSDNLESAKEINPNNPRMYYMKGISTFYTPKAYGGGKKAAMPYFEKADGLFANEKADDINKPYWGHTPNTYFLGQCKIEDKE